MGAIAGLKPTRRDLDFSIDEPTVVGYATFEVGEPGKLYYSGTGGVLGSLYKGKTDRLELLLDQRATLSPKLSIYSTTEADRDVGGRRAEQRHGAAACGWESLRNFPGASLPGGPGGRGFPC